MPERKRNTEGDKFYSYSNIRVELVRESIQEPYLISNADDVFKSMVEEVSKLDREHFLILCLNF